MRKMWKGKNRAMIKIEKRIMPWCEECENFEPNTICLSGQTVNGESIDKRIVVECINADICSNAVHQYQKLWGMQSIL